MEQYEKCYMEFFSKHLLYSMVDKISASNDWDVVFKLKLKYNPNYRLDTVKLKTTANVKGGVVMAPQIKII
jgi:hypothetical protein